MSAFVHSKEFSEFRKARSNMLLSRKNQLLLEFSFWNEPIPRSGPNIYELRSYQLRVSPAVGGHHVPSFLCAAGHTPLMLRAVAGHVFCDVCLAHFLPCPVLLLISFFGLFGFFFFFFCCAVCGILVPWPGIEPIPLFIGSRVLTTGPPGKSLVSFLFLIFFLILSLLLSSFFIALDIRENT